MKIAYIGIKGLPSRGGAERVVEAITERLKEKHNLTVYCNSRYTPRGTRIPGIRLIRIPTPKGKHFQPFSLFLLSAFHALFRGNYDLVHVHNMETCIVLPFLLPRFKVIATAHGQPYKVERWGPIARSLLRLTEYFFVFLPHIRTSVSLPFAKYCESRYHRKVHYIPNGVEITEQVSPPTRPAAAELVRDAEDAEKGGFIENPETRILNKASGLQPEERGSFCLSSSPRFTAYRDLRPDKQKTSFLSDLSASAVKTEPEDFSPPSRPEKPGLVRDAEDAEEGVFLENREMPILKKASGLQPGNDPAGERTFCLSSSPDKQKTSFLCDLSVSAVKPEPEDFSPPTCPPRAGGLIRDAESAEGNPAGEETFPLPASPGKENDDLLSDLSASAVKEIVPCRSDLGASAVKPYILFAAGRIIPSKGCHLLLKAFREIRADVDLFVLGNLDVMPGYARELRELADDRVRFVPFIESRDDLAGLIRGALCFVFPSSLEAMSMMLLEVAATGTPILSSDIPENRAVLEDRALYFRSGDETDLMNQLRWAIEHPNDMKTKGYAAQEQVIQNYPWEKIVNQYEELYQEGFRNQLAAK